MNVLVVVIAGFAAFGLASRFYGGWIARKLGVDPGRPTPARQIDDGRDYVPTRLSVLFAHHFSAIAGAGPIVGPTLAAIYGFVPAVLWIVLGGIFIGAVHDFTALFASLREGGKSMAEIARKSMGKGGFVLFLLFTLVMIVLITAVFLKLTAAALTSLYPMAKLGAEPGALSILHTRVVDGVEMGVIGGIASTSVIIITLLAPLLGWMLYRRRVATWKAYLFAAALCFGSVLVGLQLPLSIGPTLWMVLISIYVLFAAGAPVWVILQPRDFINSQLLYGGILLLFGAILSGGLGGLRVTFPAFNLTEGIEHLGLIWPMMFVTIACGAISGFHCLVASGTTCKQCSTEADAKRIGFDGMLLECILALLVVLAIGTMGFADYRQVVWVDGNPVLGFALAAGRLFHTGLPFVPVALGTVFGILMLEGFLVTTLDAAVRLNRYLLEELWDLAFATPPAFLRQYWFNAGLSVGLMWLLAGTNAATAIWPVFGSSNQLLAALALLVVSTWLLHRGSSAWFTLIPAGFMMATTLYSLALLMQKHIPAGKWMLTVADVVLFALALGVIGLAVRTHATRAVPAGGRG